METKFEETTFVNSDSKPHFPTLRLAGEHPFWFEGLLSSLLIGGRDTQGQATLLETIHKKGLEPMAHRHIEIDETFYIITGQMTFSVEGQLISAPAGTTVFIKRGQQHSFTVDTDVANTLILLTPAIAHHKNSVGVR